jgi:hypothetical protein
MCSSLEAEVSRYSQRLSTSDELESIGLDYRIKILYNTIR